MKEPRRKQRDYKDALDAVPWTWLGRETPLSRLARSIVPVGNKVGLPVGDPHLSMPIQDPRHQDWVMDIEGTAFQVAPGKLMTCWHVAEALRTSEGEAYLYANSRVGELQAKRPYPLAAILKFYDMRFEDGGPGVDAGLLICPPVITPEYPYEVPPIRWGNSTRLGVGDRVFIGGYPMGKDMFFANNTNRGLIQPSFFDGIVSAIIPALQLGETRMIQISSVALAGISGGVVCDAHGSVLGMVTSGLTDSNEVSLPITYALPSEVLRPFAEAISFEDSSGKMWT